MTRSIWMDHDDEHAPVRHEITTEPCTFCQRPFYPGELSTLVDDRGRKQRRCYRCKAAADKRYLEAIGAVDPLMARYLDEYPEADESGFEIYQAEGR